MQMKPVVTVTLFFLVGFLGMLLGFFAGLALDTVAPYYTLRLPIVGGLLGAVLGTVMGLRGALQHSDE